MRRAGNRSLWLAFVINAFCAFCCVTTALVVDRAGFAVADSALAAANVVMLAFLAHKMLLARCDRRGEASTGRAP